VPGRVKEERYDRLMQRQQAISLARNQLQVGRTLTVLIEGQGEVELEEPDDSGDVSLPGSVSGDETSLISVGRSYRDAPEIDGLVLVEGAVEPGQMVQVRITGALEYDLIGSPL
jgi:ribosomal protein S12 methylthiotransferase